MYFHNINFWRTNPWLFFFFFLILPSLTVFRIVEVHNIYYLSNKIKSCCQTLMRRNMNTDGKKVPVSQCLFSSPSWSKAALLETWVQIWSEKKKKAYSFVYVVSLFSFPNWLSFLLKNLRFQSIWNLEDFTVMDFLYSLVQCPVFLLSFEMVYTPEILGCGTK